MSNSNIDANKAFIEIHNHDVVLSSLLEYKERASTIAFNTIIDSYYNEEDQNFSDITASVINEYSKRCIDCPKFIRHTRQAKRDVYIVIDVKTNSTEMIQYVQNRLKRQHSFLTSFKNYITTNPKTVETVTEYNPPILSFHGTPIVGNEDCSNYNYKEFLGILSNRVKRLKRDIDDIDKLRQKMKQEIDNIML